ncbi:28534_t:CDS:2 [Gigaspora margarita]|uniref:28534_t:CDS:1 n=1 Tax=Gigaspora margarita TaxID=4874 RepID=A0ABM8W056_GIGMA|nr:28534_t:CDS:2 [Gigaspora margarita]
MLYERLSCRDVDKAACLNNRKFESNDNDYNEDFDDDYNDNDYNDDYIDDYIDDDNDYMDNDYMDDDYADAV